MITGNLGRRGLWMALLVVGVAGVTGCTDKVKADRDRLYAENIELRQRVDSVSADLQLCQSDRDALLAKISDMDKGGSTRSAAAANTGFEQIGGITVERGSRGEITVRVPGDVLFASGQVDLKASAKSTLSQVASVLKAQYAGQTVRVEGYSDSDPIKKSKWKDNLELSLQRAAAVARHLQSQGVAKDQLYAAGFGATNFRAANDTPAGKSQNRRVEIVVVMK